VSFGSPEAVTLFETNIMSKLDLTGRVYGKDWIKMGFVPGSEVSMGAFKTDVKGLATVDYYGDPVAQYEILDDLDTMEDFDLMVGGEFIALRQLITPTKIPFIVVTLSMDVPTFVSYYGYEGGITGMIDGMRGGAEYELVASQPGIGVSNMDAMTMGHLAVTGFIILANISGLLAGREEE
jgi:hypothetical protein